MFCQLFCALAFLMPATVADAPAVSLMERAERAQLIGAVHSLRECAEALSERLQSDSATPADRYNLAYVNWRTNQALSSADKAEKNKLLEAARRDLEVVVQAEPDNAEALALLGGVLGESIGESMIRGMRLGPKSSSMLAKAAQLAPENPRVALQRGVGYLHTPPMFGGGVDKAIAELQRAKELFARQPESEPWPNWGVVDTYAWLGQALAENGRIDDARATYCEALEIEPDAGWIRFSLLPALDGEAGC